DSFFLGGILRSPAWRTAWIIGLMSGSPGTTTGPFSPPLTRSAFRSSRREPDCFLGPWQEEHSSARTGRTFFSKNSTASEAGFGSAARAGTAQARTAKAEQSRMQITGSGNFGGGHLEAGEGTRRVKHYSRRRMLVRGVRDPETRT